MRCRRRGRAPCGRCCACQSPWDLREERLSGRAFVTGAGGGIGTALCERLSSGGWEVVALARPGANASHIATVPRLTVVTADLLDEDALAAAMQGCSAVFHLAAKVHASPGEAAESFERANVDGTRAVVAAAVKSHVDALVLFSTVAVYPETEELLDETSPVGPSTPYGTSKLEAEAIALGSAGKMHVTILRLPVVYGPRDRGNVRRLIDAISRGRFVIPGTGSAVKTMVAVGNVVDACIHVVADARARGQTYIVADARAHTLDEIVGTIARQLGVRKPPRAPLALLVTGGIIADTLRRTIGLELPLSADQVRKLSTSTRYSGERIRRELGIMPRVGFEVGMAAAVRAWRAEQDAALH